MTEIAKKLLAKTSDDAGCMVWQLASVKGHPSASIGGKSQLVRRVLWAELKGSIEPGSIIRCTCNTPGCVNPQHLTKTTHASIARAKRASAQAKLSSEAVRILRGSTEHVPTLAAQLGISAGHAYKVRRNVAQRDFSSPFAWLLA